MGIRLGNVSRHRRRKIGRPSKALEKLIALLETELGGSGLSVESPAYLAVAYAPPHAPSAHVSNPGTLCTMLDQEWGLGCLRG